MSHAARIDSQDPPGTLARELRRCRFDPSARDEVLRLIPFVAIRLVDGRFHARVKLDERAGFICARVAMRHAKQVSEQPVEIAAKPAHGSRIRRIYRPAAATFASFAPVAVAAGFSTLITPPVIAPFGTTILVPSSARSTVQKICRSST